LIKRIFSLWQWNGQRWSQKVAFIVKNEDKRNENEKPTTQYIKFVTHESTKHAQQVDLTSDSS